MGTVCAGSLKWDVKNVVKSLCAVTNSFLSVLVNVY